MILNQVKHANGQVNVGSKVNMEPCMLYAEHVLFRVDN